MKGYKAFNKDLTCRNMQYKVGETYEMDESPVCCKKGYHFCKNIADVYRYYDMSDNTRICEVEALGVVVSDDDVKFCTNKIKIVKEIKSKDKKRCNSGKLNTGFVNSGYRNSGDYNSGDRNSGDYNSGDYNSGNYNSGYRNSGYYNSGYYNSGYCNSGNYNSGYYNSGNYNSGYCNTTNAKVRLFNHQTDMEFDDGRIHRLNLILSRMPQSYIYSDFISAENMTEEEKKRHPEHKTIGEYVKVIKVEADKLKWWNEEVSVADKEFIKSLPHYDEDVFFESTGIKNN